MQKLNSSGWFDINKKESILWLDYFINNMSNSDSDKQYIKTIILKELNKDFHTRTISIEAKKRNDDKYSTYIKINKLHDKALIVLYGEIDDWNNGWILSPRTYEMDICNYIKFEYEDYSKKVIKIDNKGSNTVFINLSPILVPFIQKSIEENKISTTHDIFYPVNFIHGIFGYEDIFVLKIAALNRFNNLNRRLENADCMYDYLITPFGNMKIESSAEFNTKRKNLLIDDFLCETFNLNIKDITEKGEIYNKVAEQFLLSKNIDF